MSKDEVRKLKPKDRVKNKKSGYVYTVTGDTLVISLETVYLMNDEFELYESVE